MSESFDVAVIGAGVFGVWTARQLQQTGLRVALVEAQGPGHSRASSGDESRIIRMSYGADEIYTRWSWRALTLWQEFEHAIGAQLFHPTGVLLLAPPKHAHTLASVEALRKNDIPFEQLGYAELKARYPQINCEPDTWGLYEPASGALLARQAVQAVARDAFSKGVTYLHAAVCPPLGAGQLSALETSAGPLRAGQFIFACGPWLPKLFPALLQGRIHPTRQDVFYFGLPAGEQRFNAPHMPTWIDFSREFYGLPNLGERGFKLALDRHGEVFDPDYGERVASPENLREVRSFLAARFPLLTAAPVVESRVCQYENTCNGDFLIDRHPDFSNVWLVGGGSGHGFKHGPALGEYVAAQILNGGALEPRFTLATKAAVRQRSVY